MLSNNNFVSVNVEVQNYTNKLPWQLHVYKCTCSDLTSVSFICLVLTLSKSLVKGYS